MIERRRVMMLENEPYTPDYLRFTALENSVFTLTIPSSVTTSYLEYIEYSVDDGANWVKTNNSSSQITVNTPLITEGNSILWRGKGTRMATSSNAYSKFSSTGKHNVSGNIGTLLWTNSRVPTSLSTSNNYAFYGLFYNDSNLMSVRDLILPFTKLCSNCYGFMFCNCSGIVEGAILPATTLATDCYYRMYRNCTNLVTPSELPATTLEKQCYNNMFGGCTKLTTAPELPATTLVQNCYINMFQGCSGLKSVTCLATDISASGSTSNWLYNTASSGTFKKAAGVTWPTGASGIPNGWTVVSV